MIKNHVDIAYRLLSEAHTSVFAGTPFGAPNRVRISLAASEKDLNEGLGRILAWLKS